MIESQQDISTLLTLNVDLSYLMTNADSNTPERIFQAIAKKLSAMNYVLLHRDDLQPVEDDQQEKAVSSPILVPME
jgi:hypothetical protein